MNAVLKKNTKRSREARRGLSLIECLLSIAILGMAIVAIAELVRLGYRSAAESKRQTEAYMICDTKMAEVVAGVLPLESAGSQTVEENPDWTFAVEVGAADGRIGMLKVRVIVELAAQAGGNPLSYSIDRLVHDPDYEPISANDIQNN